MTNTATISEKGQVTIPKTLRDRLGLRPGEVLEFWEESGKLVARKRPRADRFDRVYGILGDEGPTEEWMKLLRGDRDQV